MRFDFKRVRMIHRIETTKRVRNTHKQLCDVCGSPTIAFFAIDQLDRTIA